MINFPLPDVLLILLTILLYVVGWRSFKKKQFNTALVLLLLSGLILRVYLASDQYVHAWDERYHAVVAKNLIQEPLTPKLYADPVMDYDYKQWGGNHIWLHKPPLPLWGMATSMWLFGVNIWALRLPSILLSTLAILLMYHVGKGLFNRRVGFVAALLLSFNGLLIELVSGRVATDHVDVFFFFFILLSVFFIVRLIETKRRINTVFIGIAMGCAILSKWLPALIVLPVYLLIVFQSRKFPIKIIGTDLGVICATATLIAIPWQLYIYHYFPLEANWESEYNFRHLTESLGHYHFPVMYHFHNLRIIYGELVYVPCLWLIYKLFKRRPVNLKHLAIVIWFIVPFLFFTFAITKMQAYTLMAAPAIFLIIALFWDFLSRFKNKFRYRLIPYIFIIGLIGLPARYGWERLKPLKQKDRNPAWLVQLESLEIDPAKPTVIFNCSRPIEAMFHLDCTAYAENPDGGFKKQLMDSGYEVLTLK